MVGSGLLDNEKVTEAGHKALGNIDLLCDLIPSGHYLFKLQSSSLRALCPSRSPSLQHPTHSNTPEPTNSPTPPQYLCKLKLASESRS